MRLLVAEDEREIGKALKLILERSKYSVDWVDNGMDALEYLLTGSYDGAVLDIMMPGQDGIAVLTALRRAGLSTPVLLLTAKAELSDRLAQAAALTEDSLDLTWYQSADETEESLLDYTDIDLASDTLGDTMESFALTDAVSLYRLQDGGLVESTSADLAQGGDVIASVTPDGPLTQLILLPSASDASDAAGTSAAPDSGADT